MFFPPIIPIEDLRNVHPWVKSLLSAKIVPNLSLAGRLNHFLEAWDWEILTKDPEILEIVKGFKKPFLKNLTQERILHTPHMGQEQATLIQVEIGKMLKKGAIQQKQHEAEEFLSNIFLVGKRDGRNQPVVNSRYLNQLIPHQHFKLEVCFASANHYKREITCASWIWKMLIFQFHCIRHQGAIFGFHGQGILTSSTAYVPACDQLQQSSQNCR